MALSNVNGTVLYVGDNTFSLTAPGGWREDVQGIDNLSEKWQGGIPYVATFEAGLTLGAVHPTYLTMWLKSWDSDQDPVWPTYTLEYIGFKSGTPRGPFYTSGLSLQSASGSAVDSAGNTVQIEAQFLAQQGDYEWWQFTAPTTTPANSGVVSASFPTITRWHITVSGSTGTSVSLADATTALNSLTVENILQSFTPEILIPGKLWHCRSSSVNTWV